MNYDEYVHLNGVHVTDPGSPYYALTKEQAQVALDFLESEKTVVVGGTVITLGKDGKTKEWADGWSIDRKTTQSESIALAREFVRNYGTPNVSVRKEFFFPHPEAAPNPLFYFVVGKNKKF